VIASKRSGWRSPVHALQWETTLETYCKAIRDRRVNKLDIEDVLRVLTPIWQRIPETASRIRGRLEMIFDYAKARGWRSGENPAAMSLGACHRRRGRASLSSQRCTRKTTRDDGCLGGFLRAGSIGKRGSNRRRKAVV
jgi:hypothetical protein